jgi:hypothetical protein
VAVLPVHRSLHDRRNSFLDSFPSVYKQKNHRLRWFSVSECCENRLALLDLVFDYHDSIRTDTSPTAL